MSSPSLPAADSGVHHSGLASITPSSVLSAPLTAAASQVAEPPPGGGEKIHYYQLDALRGFAASSVVIHHAVILTALGMALWWRGQAPDGLWQWAWFRTPLRMLHEGKSAVVLFFMLSGFVLSLPWLDGRPQSYATFIVRRFCRIYLPYAAAMIGSAALWMLIGRTDVAGTSDWWPNIWRGTVADAFDLNTLLAYGHGLTLNHPAWTLGWELQVSLVLPLCLAAVPRFGRRGLLPGLVILGLGWIAARAASPAILAYAHEGFPYAALFILGAALASYAGPIRQFRPHSSLITSALAIGGFLMLCPVWAGSILVSSTFLGAGAAMLIAAALRDGWFANALLHPVPLWLGRISFSLYLLHLPVITAVLSLTHGVLGLDAGLALGVVASFALAPVFHRVIEKPSQDLGRRFRSGPKPASRTILL